MNHMTWPDVVSQLIFAVSVVATMAILCWFVKKMSD